MPQLLSKKRDPEREGNILKSTEIDDRIFEILNSSPNMTESDALDLALKIQQAVRGSASMLDNLDKPSVADEYQRLKAVAQDKDAALNKFEKDRTSYVKDVEEDSKKSLQGMNEAELRQRGLALFKQMTRGSGRRGSKYQDILTELGSQPTVRVKILGRMVRKSVGGVIREVETPEIVTYKGINISLAPGERDIPISLAGLYNQRMRDRQDAEDSKGVYKERPDGGYPEYTEAERRMREQL